MVCDLPPSSQVKRLAGELNKIYPVRPSPHGIVGAQQSLRECLSICFMELIRKLNISQCPPPLELSSLEMAHRLHKG